MVKFILDGRWLVRVCPAAIHTSNNSMHMVDQVANCND